MLQQADLLQIRRVVQEEVARGRVVNSSGSKLIELWLRTLGSEAPTGSADPSGDIGEMIKHLVKGTDRFATKTLTFTGASGFGQAGTNATLFTVTGDVLVRLISTFCTTNLGEAAATATVALGVVNNTGLFIAATNSVDIDSGEFWVSTTPTANGIAAPAATKDVLVTQNIVVGCAAQNTNAGVLRADVWWRPLSSDGNLVAA